MNRPVARPEHGPSMLYRLGHAEKLHGIWVDWIVVEHHEVDDALADGWYRTPADAKAATEAVAAEPEQPAKKVK